MEEQFNGFRIERLNDNNISDLCYLFKTVHNRAIAVDYFRRKFDTEWTGKKNIGFFAYAENGEPAAFYGVFPCFITDRAITVLACQSGDTITNPRHQRKGLFLYLAERTYALARSEGIKLVFGFPNKNSSHGFFNKLDWKMLDKLNDYQLNYRNIRLYNFFHRFEFLSAIYVLFFRLLYIFISSPEGIDNSGLQDGTFGILRDKDFYLYKKYDKSYTIKWKGYKIWLKFDDGIVIGDIERFDIENRYRDFFSALRQLCFVLGVNKARIFCSPDSFADKLFSKMQKPDKGMNSGFRLFDKSVVLKTMKFTPGDMDTF